MNKIKSDSNLPINTEIANLNQEITRHISSKIRDISDNSFVAGSDSIRDYDVTFAIIDFIKAETAYLNVHQNQAAYQFYAETIKHLFELANDLFLPIDDDLTEFNNKLDHKYSKQMMDYINQTVNDLISYRKKQTKF